MSGQEDAHALSPPCVVCGAEIKGSGHDAAPVREGKCCDTCYLSFQRVTDHLAGQREALAQPSTDRFSTPLETLFCGICQTHSDKGMVFPCCNGFICWEEGNPDRQCALQFRMSFGTKTKLVLHPDGTMTQEDPHRCPYCRTPIPVSFSPGQLTAMLRKKAAKGGAFHQFVLAKHLMQDVGTPQAHREARQWLVKSAAQHFPGAMHKLAGLKVDEWQKTREDSLVDQAIDLVTRCVGQPHITDDMLVQSLCLFTRELYMTPDVLPRDMRHAHTMPTWLRATRACKKNRIPVGCANCDSKYILGIIKNGRPGVDIIGNPRKPGTDNWCPCMAVRYCSEACQREHWKKHKKHHKKYMKKIKKGAR